MLIEEGMTATCDIILLKGEALINEAIITGNFSHYMIWFYNKRWINSLIENILGR